METRRSKDMVTMSREELNARLDSEWARGFMDSFDVASDEKLVEVLRSRGYTVTVTKTIEL